MDLIRTDFRPSIKPWYDDVRQFAYEQPLPVKLAASVVGAPIALAAGAEVAAVLTISAGVATILTGWALLTDAPKETVVRTVDELAGYRNPFGSFRDMTTYVRHPKDKSILIPANLYHETILPEQAADLIDDLKSVGPVSELSLRIGVSRESARTVDGKHGQFTDSSASVYDLRHIETIEEPAITPLSRAAPWVHDFPTLKTQAARHKRTGELQFCETRKLTYGLNAKLCRRYGFDSKWLLERTFQLHVHFAGPK